ncbi:MAG: ABC transporter ATP-binding protein [Actinobacteria bacterium]|nr:ABC transporter ATP-binding protein [Actinomycetota bacterium]
MVGAGTAVGAACGAGGAGPVLEVTDLAVSFPTEGGILRAVRGMSYEVRPGEVLGIAGESGCGKSVSALAVMGLLPTSAQVSGSVRLRGRQLLGLDDPQISAIRGKRISMVFQDPLSAFTPVYTVGAQIAEAVRAHAHTSREQAARRAVELLDLVGMPDASRRTLAFPHELSGGMRQRAMIAMAIANDPEVIIADEPTTALDVTVQAQVLDVLRTAQQATGAAIVMITHDLGVLAGVADRLVVMYAGRPVESGPVEEVFHAPRMPYTIGLLGSIPRVDAAAGRPLTPVEGSPPSLVALPPGCPFAPRCPLKVAICVDVEPALEPTGSGDHLAACHRSGEIEAGVLEPAAVFPVPPPAEPSVMGAGREERAVVLEVRELVKSFPLTRGGVFRRRVGTIHAVDGVSFDLRESETLALVGESGSGKSTTVNEILALSEPMGGSVVVLGRETSTLEARTRKEIRRDLGVVFQDPSASLDPRMPLGDILTEGLRTHGVGRDQRRRRVGELLRLVGLDEGHISRYPEELSGGQQQRIAIARALAVEPKVVVLDEPVSALDVSIRAGIVNLLQRLKAELGLAYLFIGHDLSLVRHVADRVAVMYLGRIVEIGSVDRVFDDAAHPYTRALLSAVPVPDPQRERTRRRIILEGEPPSAVDLPSGCRFRPRCPLFVVVDAEQRQRCIDEDPSTRLQGVDHRVACHHAELRHAG